MMRLNHDTGWVVTDGAHYGHLNMSDDKNKMTKTLVCCKYLLAEEQLNTNGVCRVFSPKKIAKQSRKTKSKHKKHNAMEIAAARGLLHVKRNTERAKGSPMTIRPAAQGNVI